MELKNKKILKIIFKQNMDLEFYSEFNLIETSYQETNSQSLTVHEFKDYLI